MNAGMCRRDACTTRLFRLFCGAAVSAARLIELYWAKCGHHSDAVLAGRAIVAPEPATASPAGGGYSDCGAFSFSICSCVSGST